MLVSHSLQSSLCQSDTQGLNRMRTGRLRSQQTDLRVKAKATQPNLSVPHLCLRVPVSRPRFLSRLPNGSVLSLYLLRPDQVTHKQVRHFPDLVTVSGTSAPDAILRSSTLHILVSASFLRDEDGVQLVPV